MKQERLNELAEGFSKDLREMYDDLITERFYDYIMYEIGDELGEEEDDGMDEFYEISEKAKELFAKRLVADLYREKIK